MAECQQHHFNLGMAVEQFTKTDRLRMSRTLQRGKARATLRRLSSTVPQRIGKP